MNVGYKKESPTSIGGRVRQEIRTEGITVDEKKPWGDAEIHKVYEYVIY